MQCNYVYNAKSASLFVLCLRFFRSCHSFLWRDLFVSRSLSACLSRYLLFPSCFFLISLSLLFVSLASPSSLCYALHLSPSLCDSLISLSLSLSLSLSHSLTLSLSLCLSARLVCSHPPCHEVHFLFPWSLRPFVVTHLISNNYM